MRNELWLTTGAVLGGLAVVLGAFGAHGLESALPQWGLEPTEVTRRLANWETAVRYHMYHALALVALGLWNGSPRPWLSHLAGGAFTIGTLIFSGCLYALVLSGVKILGAIVPIGGTLLILGWGAFAAAACCACCCRPGARP